MKTSFSVLDCFIFKRANGKDDIKCDDKTAYKPTEKQIREEMNISKSSHKYFLW